MAKLLANRPVPAYPPLRLSQILKLIENGSANAVSVLEWLSVFRDRLEIDDSAECQRACVLLWQAIGENERVSRIALFCAAQYLEGQQDKFPAQLVDSLDIAKPLLKGINIKRVSWLMALREGNFDTCVRMAQHANVTPFKYHKQLALPAIQQHRADYITLILPFIVGSNIQQQLPWLILCLEQMTSNEKVRLCDQLLADFTRLISPMVTWLEEHCLPSSKDTLWFELEAHSRSILKQYFKMSSYYSLQTLIDNICDHRVANLLELSERDIKQLKSRSVFWSNYSEKFNQTRLLIPYKTCALISWDKTLEVIKLPDVLEENSEVCIFDIGDRILVEILRGDASELRIFESTSRNKKRLLHDKDLTLRRIREMACASIHDHVALWQYFCEQTLRVQHAICPNSGLRHFKGIASRSATYSEKTGLPAPTDSFFLERLKQLDSWNHAFWAREAKIKGRNSLVIRDSAWRELEEAKIAKFQNKREEYLNLLKIAANKGNAEAMYLFGLLLIHLPANLSSDKAQGQKLIDQSANIGFLPAIEVANSFKNNQKFENKIRSNEEDMSYDVLLLGQQLKMQKKIPDVIRELGNKVSVEIEKKIRIDSDRPFLELRIEELEYVSNGYSDTKDVAKIILTELGFRARTYRVVNLIKDLKRKT